MSAGQLPHALVTGGTSGIGRAIAQTLVQQQWRVTVTGLTSEQCGSVATSEGVLSAIPLDVTSDESVQRLAGEIDQLQLLVNCAGMIQRDEREFDPANFARVVDVNLTGSMRTATACRDLLARSKGSIINMASMLSFFGSGYVPAYSASKGGIAQLTKSLAIAWAPRGIRVNAIAPGWIKTAMTEPLWKDRQRSEAILQRTPLQRWGEPEDVAAAVLFLASPAARFITGVVLPVDGGYSIA